MTQHAGLDEARWARFDLDPQILMIGNEMNRATRLMAPEDQESRRRGYERILRLVDLTVAVASGRSLRRELLRWRGLIAELYLADQGDEGAHRRAFKALLQLRPAAARQIPYLLGAFLIVALGGCDAAGPPAAPVQVSDSAGIRIVHHAAGGVAPVWRADFTAGLVLGGATGGDELFGVTGALQLSDGRLLVADAGSDRLLFFDAEGVLFSEVGRDGEGPGEYKDITVISRGPSDSLLVWDRTLRRMSVLDASGMFARSFSLEQNDSVPFANVVGVYADGSLAASGFVDVGRGPVSTGRHAFPSAVHHFSRDGAFLATTGRFSSGESYFESVEGGGFRIAPALFARRAHRLTAGNRLLFASSEAYELRYHRPGGPLDQVVRRESLATPVTPAARADEIALLVDEAPPRIREYVEGVLAGMEAPALLPEIREVFADAMGRVWVHEFRPGRGGDQAPWDVFGEDGALLGRITLPERFRPTDAGENHVMGVVRDEVGIERVVWGVLIMPES